jgi:hypothetical protein
MPKNTLESIQYKVPELLISSIKGENIGIFKARLIALAQLVDKTPYEIFSEINYLENKRVFDDIVDLLTFKEEDKKALLSEYQYWYNHLHLSDNLIHFLEFLASKKFYRFQPYIALIHSLKPYESKVLEVIVGTLSLGTLSLIATFFYNHDLWLVFREFLEKNGPDILKFLIDYILLAENLALISLFFKIFKFFNQLYAIISNHAKTESDKIKEIIKLCLSNVLVISAQLLCFLNSGLMTPIVGYLFIAASLCDVVSCMLSIMHLKQPKDIDNTLLSNSSYEDRKNYCAAKAQFFEQKAFYDQQINTSFFEIIAFMMITGATVVSFMFFPDLFILCVVFQTICSIFKDMLIKYYEKQVNRNLQISIDTLYQENYISQPAVKMALAAFTNGLFKNPGSKNPNLVNTEILEADGKELSDVSSGL